MRNYSKIIVGALLIVVGFVFLGRNYGWFDVDISFYAVAKWWPLLIILAGIGVFIDQNRKIGNPLTLLCVAFAMPLALYSATNEGISTSDRAMGHRSGHYDKSHNGTHGHESEDGQPNEQVYNVENELGIERASLDLGGGAAEFHLEPSTDQLFYAKTHLTAGTYKLETDNVGTAKEIVFQMNDRNNNKFEFDTGSEFNNNVYLKMNPKVRWDVRMGIGAGEVDVDFSSFKIEKLKIETGVAAMKIKLSDLVQRTDVDVEAGVAKVAFAVPESVGCRIKMDGALNSKSFEGDFKKVDDGHWETPGFDTSEKKIYIQVESGLSSITFSRY